MRCSMPRPARTSLAARHGTECDHARLGAGSERGSGRALRHIDLTDRRPEWRSRETTARPPADRVTGSPARSTSTPSRRRQTGRGFSAASVNPTPGARTAWHTHPHGQTIWVTEGVGLCQRRGGPIEIIRPGDRVFLEPGEVHWHGATPIRFMTHLAMQQTDDAGNVVVWGDHVTDDEYAAAAPIDTASFGHGVGRARNRRRRALVQPDDADGLPERHRIAGCDREAGDRSGPVCDELVLHLHRLDDADRGRRPARPGRLRRRGRRGRCRASG